VEAFLRADRSEFWKQVHDLPVAEIGTVTASGVHEWWAGSPSTISFAPLSMQETLEEFSLRYQDLFIDGSSWTPDEELIDAVRDADCEIHVIDELGELRTAILERLGYEPDFVPDLTLQSGLTEY
jgi:hypothetical protein